MFPVETTVSHGAKRRLPSMHVLCILVHMRTTLNIDDAILKEASELTGITEKTSLVRMGLESLISLENRKRLIALGGSQKRLGPIPRRRSNPSK
jgi:Arc/MetJ family transcription regulator